MYMNVKKCYVIKKISVYKTVVCHLTRQSNSQEFYNNLQCKPNFMLASHHSGLRRSDSKKSDQRMDGGSSQDCNPAKTEQSQKEKDALCSYISL